ncbi:collagen alpha-1 chain-like [Limosa lapponica baueri]|uniref:Collagen alpha-1 chain-like n=1 Tax=Limosa lapponica baueri TaxID=1758121 RepID=A0A2I0T3K1_LIMLA|nr:collagen alpha-1 chain-like [Limosa lapponica baueri]
MKEKVKENESGISKALDEIGGMKAAQSRMGEDIQAMQEALGLPLPRDHQPPMSPLGKGQGGKSGKGGSERAHPTPPSAPHPLPVSREGRSRYCCLQVTLG